MTLVGTAFELSSYRRNVAIKYFDFLSLDVPTRLHASLLQDLETLCADSTTHECIREVTDILKSRNAIIDCNTTGYNVVYAIQKCTQLYPLYQLLFLIDPTAAEAVPE